MNISDIANNDKSLNQIDNETLIAWGDLHDKIKNFIKAHIDTQENAELLYRMICDSEMFARLRTRVSAARWFISREEYR